jgi:hypothetical protein
MKGGSKDPHIQITVTHACGHVRHFLDVVTKIELSKLSGLCANETCEGIYQIRMVILFCILDIMNI